MTFSERGEPFHVVMVLVHVIPSRSCFTVAFLNNAAESHILWSVTCTLRPLAELSVEKPDSNPAIAKEHKTTFNLDIIWLLCEDLVNNRIDFFLFCIRVNHEIRIASKHCRQLSLAAVIEDVAWLSDLFSICQLITDAQ